MLCVGCEGAVASKRSTAYKGPWCSFCLHGNQRSSAKLQTKGSSFPKVRTFWNRFLTIKQEKTFKRPFCDLHPTLPLGFTQFGGGKIKGRRPPSVCRRPFLSQRVFHDPSCTILIYFKCESKKFRLGFSLETKWSC